MSVRPPEARIAACRADIPSEMANAPRWGNDQPGIDAPSLVRRLKKHGHESFVCECAIEDLVKDKMLESTWSTDGCYFIRAKPALWDWWNRLEAESTVVQATDVELQKNGQYPAVSNGYQKEILKKKYPMDATARRCAAALNKERETNPEQNLKNFVDSWVIDKKKSNGKPVSASTLYNKLRHNRDEWEHGP